ASASPSVPAPGSPSPASSGPAPIPVAVLNAVTAGSSATIDVVPSPGSVLADPGTSRAAALRTALSHEPPGSKVLGMSLARVKGFGSGSDMTRPHLAWLVSVDPWGGAYGVSRFGCGRITYDVELIDPDTGRWLSAASGRQPGMPPLPILGPAPTTSGCGAPIGHRHQGTPAAN
ncbi:MAG TPA: hypothetical protein VE864_12380, partial [Streptosporangiaceae bacterium]|nr:hypothetical protein [Streptosporangiaceae bacterium]